MSGRVATYLVVLEAFGDIFSIGFAPAQRIMASIVNWALRLLSKVVRHNFAPVARYPASVIDGKDFDLRCRVLEMLETLLGAVVTQLKIA